MEDHEKKFDELRQNDSETCSLIEEKIQLRIMDYNEAFPSPCIKAKTWNSVTAAKKPEPNARIV